MARPLYETSKHLSSELEAMQKFADKFRVRFKKLPLQYRLDFAIFNQVTDKVRGLVEVRCRTFSWEKYDTLIMSLKKIMHMRDYGKMGLSSLILLENADGLWYWKYNNRDTKDIRWGGRFTGGPSEPRDDQDAEPVVHIHKSRFTPVSLVP
jgi:hypothetical protein